MPGDFRSSSSPGRRVRPRKKKLVQRLNSRDILVSLDAIWGMWMTILSQKLDRRELLIGSLILSVLGKETHASDLNSSCQLGACIYRDDHDLYVKLVNDGRIRDIGRMSQADLYRASESDFRSSRIHKINSFYFSRSECIFSVYRHSLIDRLNGKKVLEG